MAKEKETVTINIPISITKQRLDKLASRNPDTRTEELLSGVATALLADTADGGMMIEAHHVQKIADLVGDVSGPEDIITPLERYARQTQGQDLYEVAIDPANNVALKEWAASQGRDHVEMVNENINLILSETSWIYDASRFVDGGVKALFFTGKQLKSLSKILGQEDLTGTDIVDILESATVPETPVG
jgi:hypothetical protein